MLRFKSVCSSWNRATKASFPQTSPWLMLPSNQENQDHDDIIISTRCFYSLKEKKVYPTANGMFRDFDHDAWCVGSSHAWLVIVDQKHLPHLFNPISGLKIPLPQIMPLVNFENLPKNLIAKAALSSNPSRDNNFVVVIIYGGSRLKFYKHAEGYSKLTWTDLKGAHKEYSDVTFLNEQLFALSGDGSVEVWDFKNSIPVKTIHFRPTLEKIDKVDMIKDFPSDKYSSQTYLVESLGEILFVGRVIGNFVNHEGIAISEGECDDDICPYRTMQFYVLKLDFNSRKWEKVESLHDRALFLGGNQSISLSTRDFPRLEENSIYFTDDRWEEINLDGNEHYGGHDLGVYNLGDKIVKPIYEFDKWRIDPPPFWIVPNPW